MLEFNNKKLNIIIGLSFIVVMLVFFAGIYNTKNSPKKDVNINFYKVYISNVVGIKKNQPVTIGGYPVGFVQAIKLDKNLPFLILGIDKNIHLTADSSIQVSNISLLSSTKFIRIINGIDDDILNNNSYIPNANLGINLDKLLNMIEIYLTHNK